MIILILFQITVLMCSETEEKLLKLYTPASSTQFTMCQTNLVTVDKVPMENTFALRTIATLQQQSKRRGFVK